MYIQQCCIKKIIVILVYFYSEKGCHYDDIYVIHKNTGEVYDYEDFIHPTNPTITYVGLWDNKKKVVVKN
jgi:hypothetical protein